MFLMGICLIFEVGNETAKSFEIDLIRIWDLELCPIEYGNWVDNNRDLGTGVQPPITSISKLQVNSAPAHLLSIPL
jgi:hypothetical protein